MNPGRELDALVAEKVMGLKLIDGMVSMPHYVQGRMQEAQLIGDIPSEIRPYSTDIAAAWEVVEYVRRKTFLNAFSLFGPTDESYKWFAGFDKKWAGRDGNAIYDLEGGETAPHAICLAALKAAELNNPTD